MSFAEDDENVVYDYGEDKPKRGQPQIIAGGKSKHREDDDSDDRIVGAFVLIGLGVFFLLKSVGVIGGGFSWWPLILLIVGGALIVNVWTFFMRQGYVDEEQRGKAFGGVMVILVGMIFLLDLDWGQVWPLFLIVPGIGLLFGWIGNNHDEDDE